ncbi:phenylalanine--tRNA ligase beta subunit [Acidaminococcus sp. CAG:917]|nr:phenylalanine--tRNA ligase beta subunit [Acidaminococcus sp. CAG:917]
MRTTLLHSILEIVASNESKSQKNLALFEVAKVYIPKKLPLTELPDEVNTLAVALSGEAEDFFTLKNVVEKLGKAVGVEFSFKKKIVPYLHDGQSAEIFVGDTSIGVMGQIHPLVAETYGISKTFALEINLDVLEKFGTNALTVKEISKFPTVERDLAVVVDDGVIAGDMLQAIKGEGIPNLDKAEIFDVFKGAQVGENKKSIAFNFEFVSYEKTLVDAEVNEAMDRVLKLLETKFGAKIR